MKCCAVIVTCMETAMEDDGYNLTLERIKVWHGNFLAFTKEDGLGSDGENSRERLTSIS